MERIRISNVLKCYANRCIFHQTNISFYSGEIIGLIGENGIGKTTLIKLLCGLIRPDEGQIFINGINIQNNKAKCMKSMGVLLEGSRSVYWRLSAWQNFIYFSGLKGVFGKEACKRAEELFNFLEIWETKDQKAETLSYGMKQRLAFACSISHYPSVVLLDEPTTGLDSGSNLIFERFTKQLSHENKTIVIASHDHGMVKRLSHKTFKIEDGLIKNVS